VIAGPDGPIEDTLTDTCSHASGRRFTMDEARASRHPPDILDARAALLCCVPLIARSRAAR